MSTLNHKVVSHEEWAEARAALLKKEKEMTRAHDALTQQIRNLPWVKMLSTYIFHTPHGDKTLADLFGTKSQLFVVHFMFAPGSEACSSCSFWADHYGPLKFHLPQRDVAFTVVSRAPLEQIEEYKKRMGWDFEWVSSFGSEFNYDLDASVRDPDARFSGEEPGFSVFFREGGEVYRTYSTKWRGIESLNSTYAVLDLVPKGRDEGGLSNPMAWVKKHDEY
jgi:predicted dithiol-disulfide oxidoreductase (DUF899 family)